MRILVSNLHIHTNASFDEKKEIRLSAKQAIQRIMETLSKVQKDFPGDECVAVIAITDHNSIGAIRKAEKHIESLGLSDKIKLVYGMELSVSVDGLSSDEGDKCIHINALNFNITPAIEGYSQLFSTFQGRRAYALSNLLDKTLEVDIDASFFKKINWNADVFEEINKALTSQGMLPFNEKDRSAISEIADEIKAYSMKEIVKLAALPYKKAFRMMQSAGATLSLNHPGTLKINGEPLNYEQLENLIKTLTTPGYGYEGISGIEIFADANYKNNIYENILKLAGNYGLLSVVSNDYHGAKSSNADILAINSRFSQERNLYYVANTPLAEAFANPERRGRIVSRKSENSQLVIKYNSSGVKQPDSKSLEEISKEIIERSAKNDNITKSDALKKIIIQNIKKLREQCQGIIDSNFSQAFPEELEKHKKDFNKTIDAIAKVKEEMSELTVWHYKEVLQEYPSLVTKCKTVIGKRLDYSQEEQAEIIERIELQKSDDGSGGNEVSNPLAESK